jgi:hypothetical protein
MQCARGSLLLANHHAIQRRSYCIHSSLFGDEALNRATSLSNTTCSCANLALPCRARTVSVADANALTAASESLKLAITTSANLTMSVLVALSSATTAAAALGSAIIASRSGATTCAVHHQHQRQAHQHDG